MSTSAYDYEIDSAARVLAAVVAEAEYTADLLAGFLTAIGYRPSRKMVANSDLLPEDDPLVRQARTVLLALAAGLRIATWESAGFRSYLSEDLPSSGDVYRALLPSSVGNDGGPVAMPKLSQRVLGTWFRHFSHTSRAELGIDVLMRTDTANEEDLLEAMVDFLLENRHLAAEGEHAHG